MEIDRKTGTAAGDETEEKRELSPGGNFSSFAFRFAVSLALLILIFRTIDFGAFSGIIVSPKIWPLVFMIVFSLFFVFLGGLKLWVLYKEFNPINPWLFIGYYFLAGSIGSLAPSIFGDVTLIGLAKRSRIPIHKSISAILMDRGITLVVALFIFTPFTLLFVLPINPGYVFLLTGAVLIVCIGFFKLSLQFAPSLLGKFKMTKMLWESFFLFFSHYRPVLYVNLVITSLRSVVSGITLILALMAANLNPAFWATVCISNSLSVLTHIPVSLSGLGLFEGSGLILFEAIGLNREQVLAGLLYHRVYIITWAALTSLILTLFFTIKNTGKKYD